MRRCFSLAFLCIPIFIFFNPLFSAQSESGPRMYLQEKFHDFKEVSQGAVVAHTFIVENRGVEVLQIQRVNPG